MKRLNFEQYNARWIWNAAAQPVNSYVRFIHDFEIEDAEDIEDARLLISSDSNYLAYINGKVVGYGQYADFPYYKVYDEYCIERLLKKGNNRLCVMGYHQGVDSHTYIKADAGLIFAVIREGTAVTASGAGTLSAPCPSYVNGPVENISPQLSFTFRYHAEGDEPWLDCGYSADDWDKSIPVNKEIVLYPRPVQKLLTGDRIPSKLCAQGLFLREKNEGDIGLVLQSDYFSARRISEISDWDRGTVILPDPRAFVVKKEASGNQGAYLVFDLGREETGLLNLEIDAAEGTVFDIGYGEHLDDLRVRSHVGGRNFACSYVSKAGRQNFIHWFKRLGCRYVQLHVGNMTSDVKIYYAGLLPVVYPLSYMPVALRDKLHQKIYDVSVRTLELCMHEHYEDCPWREQALYAMDSRNQALCGYYSFGEYNFPESNLRLLALSLEDDGLLALCAPAGAPITIPSFTLNWVMELYEFYQHSGRTGFVEEMFETVKIICTKAVDRMQDGLLSCYHEAKYWNFYEWAPGLEGGEIFRNSALKRRIDAPLNMYLIIALDSAAHLAKATGQIPLAEQWTEHAEKLRSSVREMFFDGDSGLYYTYRDSESVWHTCELTQALALCSGCSQGHEAETIREKLVDPDSGLIPVTLSYTAFKYDALLQEESKYHQWVFDNIAETWGDMLFNGATSFWETKLGADDFDYAGSLCHGWSAMPIYYYHKFGKTMWK